MQILVDTHSHTIASGHAYSTLSEMARAAARKGLQALAVTEHAPQLEKTCGLFYFMNYDVIPREMNGVRLLMGAELNIMDSDGTVDLPEDVCRGLDIAIASIHPPCYQSEASVENNTRAYVEVMKKPYVNIIGHPDDSRVPVDYEVPITTGSDAHIDADAGNFERAKELLAYCSFPEELVVTTDFEKIRPFLNIGKSL